MQGASILALSLPGACAEAAHTGKMQRKKYGGGDCFHEILKHDNHGNYSIDQQLEIT